MAKSNKYITFGELVKESGAPFYIVKYLYQCKRLPIIEESIGAGYPTLFDTESIFVVKKHMEKQRKRLK